MTKPLVTIGIPTYQRPEYLLAAVQSALAQTHAEVQVVVSDNASTVKASVVLASIADPRLVVLEHAKTIPIFENWDACVARAEGEFFLLLSDDDVLHRDAVETLLTGFGDNDRFDGSQIGVSYGRCRIMDSAGTIVGEGDVAPQIEAASETVLQFFNSKRPTQPCGVMLRTADIRAHGGYAEQEAIGIVRDAKVWILVALQRGAVRFSPRAVADYRMHATSGTFQANIEGALRNNLALAELCASVLEQAGQTSLIDEIRTACKRLNSRVFVYLLRPQEKYRNRPLRTLFEFVRLSGCFLSFRTVPSTLLALRQTLALRSALQALKARLTTPSHA